MSITAMKQALEALEQEAADYSIQYVGSIPDHIADAITALRQAIEQAEKQEMFKEYGEGWESLAWELCADECGEEACTELIWEGGPIPEPWGDRWLKYEDEAKRLIALVQKHTTPQPQQEPVAWVNCANLQSAAVTRNRGGQGDTHSWSETPTAYHSHPLYTTQPTAPVQEPVAWWVNSGHEGDVLFDEAEACRYALTINGSVTPLYTTPQPQQEPVAWEQFHEHIAGPFYTTPQPQREWVGLTQKELDDIWDEHHDAYGYQLSANGYERAIEAKLKEKNT